MCEEALTQSDSNTVPSSLRPPVMQDAEAQANTEALWEVTDGLQSPVATGTSCPTGEDVEVQTDFTAATPPQQHIDVIPTACNATAVESAGKKDMATLTDELDSRDCRRGLFHTSETSTCQDSTQSAPAVAKAPSLYATDSEPKPKPSNELTRDYIPKVGMTTYTIVPQKSLEKLRYFEVALTLETPPAVPEEGLHIGSLPLDESTAQRGKMEVSEERSELHSALPRDSLLTSTAANQDTVNGGTPESLHSCPTTGGEISSSPNGPSQAGPPEEVKEIKVPPATKPKPGSFRLAQHKKTPGYYVTSAAEKSLSGATSSGQREVQGNADRAKLPPPPPTPPVQYEEETAEATNTQLSPKGNDKTAATMRITRQSSLPCKEPSVGISLEKLRSFAAPRPYSPATPSRFAQAVSSAVKRSRSLSHSPRSPQSPVSAPFSPITSRSPEAKGLYVIKVSSHVKTYTSIVKIR